MAASFSSNGPLLTLNLEPCSLHQSSLNRHNSRRCLIFGPRLDRPSPPSLRSSRSASHRRVAVVASAQSNLFKVIQTAWKVGKDGIEAGTNLVPDSVPRPVARISVAVVAATVGLFLLKSFISTAFFVLAMMGFIYFVFIAFNKDEGPRGGGGDGGGGSSNRGPLNDEEALAEVRRIMKKYK